MDTSTLFAMALGLQFPWEVKTLDFKVADCRLDILVDFQRGTSFPCPVCGQPSKVHALVQGMPVAAAARLVWEHDTRIWRILHHHVEEVRKRKDLSGVTQLGIDDETHRVESSRRGHNCITLFMDMVTRSLLFATEGRDAATAKAFKEDLVTHGGKPETIEETCIDMHQAFINGIQAHFPNAHLTFDRFHVMEMANEAVDQVRRAESKEHPELRRTRYCWLIAGKL